MPNLQFETVVAELPNLIEAKAVSLVSDDPSAVLKLQRKAKVGLRAYMNHLEHLGLIDPPSLCKSFLLLYEHARFSTDLLTEEDFRVLLASFSQVLASIDHTKPSTEFMPEADETSLSSVQSESASSVVRTNPNVSSSARFEPQGFLADESESRRGSLFSSSSSIQSDQSVLVHHRRG